MSYKIVVDSCCELPENYRNDDRFQSIPLGLEVGDYVIQDDEGFNQKEFLQKVADYPKCPKSSCPSPEKYREAYHDEADEIYVVTLSSHLSGSYNSAELGRSLYGEKYGPKKIHVVDSESASCGETQIVEKIVACKEAGLGFEETVEAVETFKRQMGTYFVLDNLETLRNNGRLSGIKALVATTLSIKPVMGADQGEIIQLGQAIGNKKALARMAETVAKEAKNPQEKTLMITHCNCPERAERVREMILSRISVKDVVIMDTRGVSSMYANDGGVIVTL